MTEHASILGRPKSQNILQNFGFPNQLGNPNISLHYEFYFDLSLIEIKLMQVMSVTDFK